MGEQLVKKEYRTSFVLLFYLLWLPRYPIRTSKTLHPVYGVQFEHLLLFYLLFTMYFQLKYITKDVKKNALLKIISLRTGIIVTATIWMNPVFTI